MKTENNIKEQIKELQQELGEIDNKNSFYSGFIQGQIDCLFWVLDESKENEAENE